MKHNRGFTLVELVVIIVVVAILATMIVLGLNRYLTTGRDNSRVASVTAIQEALEKYYDSNGEYPSCAAITDSGANVVANTLKGIDLSALRVPGSDSSTTNAIKCGQTLTASGTDFIEYAGDGTPGCNGTVSCSRYKLRYKSETNTTIIELTSRRG